MADKTATFGIKIKADSNAGEAATSVESLRNAIQASQDAVKNYQSSLAKLRGKSDEVKAAKEKLKAAIESERDALSASTLALGKQGHTIESVNKAARAAAEQLKAQKKAQESVKESSPLEQLKGMKDGLTDTSTAAGLAGTAVLGLAAAAVAVAGAIVGATVSLAKFVFESASALRQMSLFREAATGSASNSMAFGHQIDALADKIPKSREELQGLSLDISRAMVGTRVSGQGIVDTFNAVGQASSAMGDSAGRAIQGIIDRSKTFGRLGLGLYELQGTGIAFQDVASALASNLKISLNAAQQQLRMGRVNVNDGAAAIRKAVEKQFGAINKKMMLDPGAQLKKFKDRLVGLTEGVPIEGILEGFDRLSKLFDKNTVTGSALKQLITDFGEGAGKVFKTMLPIAEKFFKQLVIESLKLEIAGIRLYNWGKKAFGPDFLSGVDGGKLAITGAKIVMGAFAVSLLSVAAAAALVAAPFVAIWVATGKAKDAFKEFTAWADTTFIAMKARFQSFGHDLTVGLMTGIMAGVAALQSKVTELATGVKDTFKAALGIHSPSKVFAEFGRQTAQGYEMGLSGEGRGVQAAANRLAPSGPIAGGFGGGGAITIEIHNVFPNAKDGKEVAATLKSSSFLADLTKALEELRLGQGVTNA